MHAVAISFFLTANFSVSKEINCTPKLCQKIGHRVRSELKNVVARLSHPVQQNRASVTRN